MRVIVVLTSSEIVREKKCNTFFSKYNFLVVQISYRICQNIYLHNVIRWHEKQATRSWLQNQFEFSKFIWNGKISKLSKCISPNGKLHLSSIYWLKTTWEAIALLLMSVIVTLTSFTKHPTIKAKEQLLIIPFIIFLQRHKSNWCCYCL